MSLLPIGHLSTCLALLWCKESVMLFCNHTQPSYSFVVIKGDFPAGICKVPVNVYANVQRHTEPVHCRSFPQKALRARWYHTEAVGLPSSVPEPIYTQLHLATEYLTLSIPFWLWSILMLSTYTGNMLQDTAASQNQHWLKWPKHVPHHMVTYITFIFMLKKSAIKIGSLSHKTSTLFVYSFVCYNAINWTHTMHFYLPIFLCSTFI